MIKSQKFFRYLGQIIIFFLGIDITLCASILIFGFSINKFIYPLSIISSCLLTAYINKAELDKKLFIASIITLLLYLFFTTLLCENIIDYSWDGNAYHKTAVGFLANGWNPVYDTAKDFVSREFPIISQAPSYPGFVWEEHYPKATWFFGSSAYQFFGNIEAGKSYTLLMILGVFSIISSSLLEMKISPLFSFIFALCSALNPIAVAQCMTYYVDGFLQLCILLLCFEFFVYLSNKSRRTITLTQITFLLIIAINIKYTGLLFSFFYIVFFLIYYLLKTKEFKKSFLLGLFFLTIGFVSTFWIGEASYTKNIINHFNLIYPIIGEGKIDIMAGQSPFPEINRISNLFASIFSRLDNQLYSPGNEIILKIPFSVHAKELANLHYTDYRLSGFGIFFSGLLVTSLLLFFFYFCSKNVSIKSKYLLGYSLFTSVFFCLLLTESWWARYAPYIYFIVLLGLISIISIKNKTMRKIILIIFGVILIVNNLLFLTAVFNFLPSNDIIKSNIKNSSYKEICLLNYTWAPGLIFNFIDSGTKLANNCRSDKDAENFKFIDYFNFKYKLK